MTQTKENEKDRYSLEKSQFVEELDGLQLWRLGQDDFDQFNDFVFRVYSEAFGSKEHVPFTRQEIENASLEYYRHAKVCGVKHPDGTILGTWGLVLKVLGQDEYPLPIEVKFGMTTTEIIQKMNASGIRFVFNGWRTAIDKSALDRFGIAKQKSIFIFDFLLRGLTEDFGNDSSAYLGVSEMEMIVLKYHRRVGIPWVILGESKKSWGRDVYPCSFELGKYEEYLKEHHPQRFDFINRRR